MNQPFELDAGETALADKVAAAAQLLAEIAGAYAPAAFANSLGAEDMVLTDLIQRRGLAIEIFSLDTGRLPQETYALMQDVQEHYGLKLKLYYPRHDLIEEYTRSNGVNAFFDSVELRRACCQVRKVEPLKRALAGKKAWITGMRAQQAMTRGALPLRQFDESNGLEKFNPLADWSEQEVWAYLRGHAVPYNALHDRHYPSIGCAPCTRAIAKGEDIRAGRWWWESADTKECGLHRIPFSVRASAEANVSDANVKARSAGRSQNSDTKECGLHRSPLPAVGTSAKANIDESDVKAQGAGRSQNADTKECGLHRVPANVSASAEANMSVAHVGRAFDGDTRTGAARLDGGIAKGLPSIVGLKPDLQPTDL